MCLLLDAFHLEVKLLAIMMAQINGLRNELDRMTKLRDQATQETQEVQRERDELRGELNAVKRDKERLYDLVQVRSLIPLFFFFFSPSGWMVHSKVLKN